MSYVRGPDYVSVESMGLGPYKAEVSVRQTKTTAPPTVYMIDVDDIPSLLLHLDNAYQNLMRRRVVDAVCGNCRQCKNVRMVEELQHGRSTTVHCPRCHPKIVKARERGQI